MCAVEPKQPELRLKQAGGLSMNGEFCVGDWLIQRDLNRICNGDKSVQVEPKVMEVLAFLAQHPAEVLSRQSILRAVWPNTYVSDEVLTYCIFELRQAFEDDAKHRRSSKPSLAGDTGSSPRLSLHRTNPFLIRHRSRLRRTLRLLLPSSPGQRRLLNRPGRLRYPSVRGWSFLRKAGAGYTWAPARVLRSWPF